MPPSYVHDLDYIERWVDHRDRAAIKSQLELAAALAPRTPCDSGRGKLTTARA